MSMHHPEAVTAEHELEDILRAIRDGAEVTIEACKWAEERQLAESYTEPFPPPTRGMKLCDRLTESGKHWLDGFETLPDPKTPHLLEYLRHIQKTHSDLSWDRPRAESWDDPRLVALTLSRHHHLVKTTLSYRNPMKSYPTAATMTLTERGERFLAEHGTTEGTEP